MAEATRPPAGSPIPPAGMNDNSPTGEDAFYATSGVYISDDLKLQRCNGKSLKGKFRGPILGISAQIFGAIFVETTHGIFLFTNNTTPTEPT